MRAQTLCRIGGGRLGLSSKPAASPYTRLSVLPAPTPSKVDNPHHGPPERPRAPFRSTGDQEAAGSGVIPQKETPVGGLGVVVHATDFAHLIDTTARPRTPQPRHRTRSFRSSTRRLALSPSRVRNAGVSNAVCPQPAQSIFTKSPGPRSSILAAYSGTISAPGVLCSFTWRRSSRAGPDRQSGTNLYPASQA